MRKKGVKPVRETGAGKPHAEFDERSQETGMATGAEASGERQEGRIHPGACSHGACVRLYFKCFQGFMNRFKYFRKMVSQRINSIRGTRKVILIFVVWVTFLLLFSFFIYAIGQSYRPETSRISGEEFFRNFIHYDAGWYITIARYGYAYSGFYRGPGLAYLSTAYWPLYPFLTRILSYPMAGNYIAAALAVSWLSMLFALIYLFKLAMIYTNEDSSFRTCLFILLFPTACFFLVPYSESLFLLCAVASFYHARRSSWILAGIWGYLACLARPVGPAIFVAIFLEALRQSGWRISQLRPRMAAVLLAPLGLVTYIAYLQWRFGDFLYFIKAQREGWQAGFHPWGLFLASKYVLMPERFVEFGRYFYLLFFLFLFAFLLAFVFKRYGYPLGFFGVICLAMSLLTSPSNALLQSMNRHVVVIFPAFMILGSWGRNRDFERLYIFAGTLGLAIFTTIYILNFFSG